MPHCVGCSLYRRFDWPWTRSPPRRLGPSRGQGQCQRRAGMSLGSCWREVAGCLAGLGWPSAQAPPGLPPRAGPSGGGRPERTEPGAAQGLVHERHRVSTAGQQREGPCPGPQGLHHQQQDPPTVRLQAAVRARLQVSHMRVSVGMGGLTNPPTPGHGVAGSLAHSPVGQQVDTAVWGAVAAPVTALFCPTAASRKPARCPGTGPRLPAGPGRAAAETGCAMPVGRLPPVGRAMPAGWQWT